MDSKKALLIVELIKFVLLGMLRDTMFLLSLVNAKRRRIEDGSGQLYNLKERMPAHVEYLDRLMVKSERQYINLLRMGRNALGRLCIVLRELGGLTYSREVSVVEQVCIFLGVLSHHKKNAVAEFDFNRSDRTVSKYFHIVLKTILKLHELFVAKTTPIESASTGHPMLSSQQPQGGSVNFRGESSVSKKNASRRSWTAMKSVHCSIRSRILSQGVGNAQWF